MKSLRVCLVLGAVLIAAARSAAAQAFNVERIFGSRDFASGLESFVWTPDGKYLTLTDDGPDGSTTWNWGAPPAVTDH